MNCVIRIFLLAATLGLHTISSAASPAPELQELLSQMCMYKIKPSGHSGNLLHHALWSGRAIAQWFDEDHVWVKGLEHEEKFLIIAAFLHDIGKMGDGRFIYRMKRRHPLQGFRLLTNKLPLWCCNRKPFDLVQLCKQLDFSAEQRNQLALFSAIHWDFGGMMKELHENKSLSSDKACRRYLAKFRDLCKLLQLQPTAHLLKMSVAVSAADVRGLKPVAYCNDLLIELFGSWYARHFNLPCYSGVDIYFGKHFEENGFPLRRQLLEMLEE